MKSQGSGTLRVARRGSERDREVRMPEPHRSEETGRGQADPGVTGDRHRAAGLGPYRSDRPNEGGAGSTRILSSGDCRLEMPHGRPPGAFLLAVRSWG